MKTMLVEATSKYNNIISYYLSKIGWGLCLFGLLLFLSELEVGEQLSQIFFGESDPFVFAFLALDGFVAYRVFGKKGFQHPNRMFYFFSFLLFLDLVWMIEAVTSVNQSIIVYPINFAQYFWLLVVGIIILSRHPKMMGSVGFFYNILSKPIGYIWLGLFFLLLGGFFIFFNFGVTEQIAILAYFSFAVGVVFQFIKVVVTKHEY